MVVRNDKTISHLSAPHRPPFFSSSRLREYCTVVNQTPEIKSCFTTNAPKKKKKKKKKKNISPLTSPPSTTSQTNNPTPSFRHLFPPLPTTRHLSAVSPTPSNSISQKTLVSSNPASYCCSPVSVSVQFFSVYIWQCRSWWV